MDKGSDTLVSLEATKVFCINVLADDQQTLSNNFAKKGPDKFADINYDAGFQGVPCLPGTLMNIQCSVHDIFDGGDHKIVVGRVEKIVQDDPEKIKPLIYYRGKYAEIS